jgi:hypothetical protein
MPAFAAACRIGRAVGSDADTSPVVIIATAVPLPRIVSNARGKSSVTFSGKTCPPGRTVRSIASYPMSITADARSLTLRSDKCFEKKQNRRPLAPSAASRPPASDAAKGPPVRAAGDTSPARSAAEERVVTEDSAAAPASSSHSRRVSMIPPTTCRRATRACGRPWSASCSPHRR